MKDVNQFKDETLAVGGWDVDGLYRKQCFDLSNKWYLINTGKQLSSNGTGGARGIIVAPGNPGANNLGQALPPGTPIQAGDIIIYDAVPGNLWGHTSVAISSTHMLEQNVTAPYDGSGPPKVNPIRLGAIKGILRLSGSTPGAVPQPAPPTPVYVAPAWTANATAQGTFTDNKDGTYSYQVVSGDTLWVIATKVFGDGNRWGELGYTGNPRDLAVGHVLRWGTKIEPPKPIEVPKPVEVAQPIIVPEPVIQPVNEPQYMDIKSTTVQQLTPEEDKKLAAEIEERLSDTTEAVKDFLKDEKTKDTARVVVKQAKMSGLLTQPTLFAVVLFGAMAMYLSDQELFGTVLIAYLGNRALQDSIQGGTGTRATKLFLYSRKLIFTVLGGAIAAFYFDSPDLIEKILTVYFASSAISGSASIIGNQIKGNK